MSRAQLTSTVEQNTGGAVAPFLAGKNKIINGDFNIWQRGTSFAAASGAFYADRWQCDYADANPTSATVAQKTFVAGYGNPTGETQIAAPVSNTNAYFFRQTITTAGSTTLLNLTQKIEDVRTFAGQTVTVSFYARSDSSRTHLLVIGQALGTGGSGGSPTTSTPSFSTTTSWQRFVFTTALSNLQGATIGTNSYLGVTIRQAIANGSVLDLWGYQVEAGSVATPFTTATGTLQGELAACQRYYFRNYGNSITNYAVLSPAGVGKSTTVALISVNSPVTMRIQAQSIDFSNIAVYDGVSLTSVTAVSIANGTPSPNQSAIEFTVASGLTQYRPYLLLTSTTAGYIGASAEL
jgi:hypothetical protein